MKKLLIYLIIGLFSNLKISASCRPEGNDRDSINDGPYFYFADNKLKVKWIDNDAVREYFITSENFTEIKDKFNLLFSYNDLNRTFLLKPSFGQNFKMVDSVAVITDVHGEYHAYITLMKAIGIIDDELNWKFGRGHLVVLGDIFDRGNMVTEIFWHLFGLEKQAVKAGGMVHVLLGNHELMVLNKDQDYLNEKYKKAEVIFRTDYSDLFSENSVLGIWLRAMPVVITINDILFVHAGVSVEMIERHLKIKQINRLFSNYIVGKDPKLSYESGRLKFLAEANGPLWYRGYFTDTDFTESRLDSILAFYDKAHIVVGHTTSHDIRSLYNNKIIGADAGIVNKDPGAMLIYKNGTFYKGTVSGKRIKL